MSSWKVLFFIMIVVVMAASFLSKATEIPSAYGSPKVIDTIPLSSHASGLVIDPTTNKLYVGHFLNANSTVSIIDGTDDRVITTIPVGDEVFPAGMVINPVTNKIYVTSRDGGISVIDGSTDRVSTISVDGIIGLSVNPVTNKLYAISNTSPKVLVINGTNSNVTEIYLEGYPSAIKVNSVTNKIYVSYSLDTANWLSIIDGSKDQIISTMPTSFITGSIEINPITNRTYILDQYGYGLSVIDGVNNKVTPIRVGSGLHSIGVNPVTNKVYVTNGRDNTLSILDETSNSEKTVHVGIDPMFVAINTKTNTIYISNSYDSGTEYGTITVINGTTDAFTDTIPVGFSPHEIGINLLTDKIYVVNSGAVPLGPGTCCKFTNGSISVISGMSSPVQNWSYLGLFGVIIAIVCSIGGIVIFKRFLLDPHKDLNELKGRKSV